MKSGKTSPLATWPAWLVHAYTAIGAVLAFLALQAAAMRNFRAAFLWLFVAVVVDATDGMLARAARVNERLPIVSGQKLDDLVDYLTFVFVPAAIVWQARVVPEDWTIPVAAAMLLSSLFGFASEDAKTADHFFTGFPSYWNIVALYLVVLRLSPVLNAAILLILSALVFVRIGYIYPTRTTTARTVTLILGSVWGLMMLLLILQMPTAPRSIAWVSLFFPLYYAILSFVLHARRTMVVAAILLCAVATAQAQTTLPAEIPIFPLEPTMLFPGVERPLHIFEPRYRAMVADALKGDRIIGMTTLKPGFEANYAGRPAIYEIGCAGIITDVEELPGGRYNIVLRGLVKFRVTSEDNSRSYRLARVTAMPEVLNDAEQAELRKRRQRLEALITKGSDTKVPPGTTDEALINMVAQHLPMDAAKRQQLLELDNLLLRAQALIDLIESKGGAQLTARVYGDVEEESQPLQELFLTEVVYPQEKREVQLTVGTLVDRTRPELSALTSFAIEYGLTDHWQIEAGWFGYTQFHSAPFKHLHTARASVGTKYSFMNIGHSPVHAAVGIDVEFPRPRAFAEDEGEEGLELEPFAALAADLGRHVTVFGSVGASVEPNEAATLADHGERPDDPGTASFGGLVAFRTVTLAAEYTTRSDGLPWRLDGDALVTPSIFIHPSHGWELAAGLPIAMRHAEHQPGFVMHVIKEF